MRLVTILAATVSLFSITGIATTASAAASDWAGWHADIGVGAASGKSEGDASYNPGLEPKGVVTKVGVGHRFAPDGHWVIDLNIGGEFGNQNASFSEVSCTVASCGYAETYTLQQSSRWSASIGGSVGHTIGRALVSVTAGLRASDYSVTDTYDVSAGPFSDYQYTRKGYRAGYYVGAKAEYALNDQWSLGAEFRHSELSEVKNEYTGGSDDSVYKENSITLGGSYRF